ncbi:MAG: ABC transporter permease subunit [Bacteroidota bacterium]
MLKLIGVELYKIYTKPRSYLGLLAITIIVCLIHIAMYSGGQEYLDFIFATFKDSFDVSGKILTGNLIAFIILQMLVVQMPLLVAFVTGDIISGEASGGTLRILAGKPYSRSHIFFSKFIACAIYTFVLVVWLGILAVVLGHLLFGSGDMMVLKTEGLVVLRDGDILWRYGYAFIIAFFILLLIASLAFCISSFAENSITPIVITMGLIIISTVIGTLEVPLFEYIKPILFTTHMIIWRNMFDKPVPWNDILLSMSIVFSYTCLFTGIAWFHFTRKDILT